MISRRVSRILDFLFLAVITGLTYLPEIGRLVYVRDDWYYMLDGAIGGPKVFFEMFRFDRPARGNFFEIYYTLFGYDPVPYHLSMFVWRLLAALAFMALFLALWPKQRRAAYYAALLFAVFPGYLTWVQGVEHMPMLASLCLQVVSIFLTLKSIQATKNWIRVGSLVGAVLTGWAYLALVEYAFGMEVFRLLCVFILVSRETAFQSFVKKTLHAVLAWLPSGLIPLGFLFWRAFLFQSERKATDIAIQLDYLIESPVVTLQWWLVRLFQSMTNVTFFAWDVPFYQNYSSLPLQNMLIGLFIAAIVAVTLLVGHWLFSKYDADEKNAAPTDLRWTSEAIWIGILGVVFGLVPVIMANRYVFFRGFTHYGLPASMAAIFLLAGLINVLSSERIRLGVLTWLVVIAALTHYSVAARAASETQIIQGFWWQVSWRVPGLKPDTTLIVTYPSIDVGLDNDIIWGPANFLYFPTYTGEIPVKYTLAALANTGDTTDKILSGMEPYRDGYRSHFMTVNFTNILLLSQLTETSCVHVMDGSSPNISSQEPGQNVSIASHSNIANVLTDVTPAEPQAVIFGTEPRHAWCYYYEKAELALQQGQWDEAARLTDQVFSQKFTPEDPVEWMPFLKSDAHFGNAERFNKIAAKMAKDDPLREQACQVLKKMEAGGQPLRPEIQQTRDALFCNR